MVWRVLDGVACVTRDFGLIGLPSGRGIGRRGGGVAGRALVHNHVKWDECKFSCCEGREGRCYRESMLCQCLEFESRGGQTLESFQGNLELLFWN